MEQREDVLIVGAGVIGLACAAGPARSRTQRARDRCRSHRRRQFARQLRHHHAEPRAAAGRAGRGAQGAALDVDPGCAAVRAAALRSARCGTGCCASPLRCNERDWRASALAKSAILNDSRARLAQWVARLRAGLRVRARPARTTSSATRSTFEHAQDEVGLAARAGRHGRSRRRPRLRGDRAGAEARPRRRDPLPRRRGAAPGPLRRRTGARGARRAAAASSRTARSSAPSRSRAACA